MRDALADDIGLAGLHAPQRLVTGKIPAGADMLSDLLAVLLAAGLLLVLLAEAVVRAAAPDQKLGVFFEQAAPLGLHIRADRAADVGTLVMVEAAFAQRFINELHRAVHKAALIGIFNAENELAVMAAGNQPGIKRGTKVSDVHVARGAGRKAGADLAGRNARFHFFKKIHRDASMLQSSTILYRFFYGSSMMDCELKRPVL